MALFHGCTGEASKVITIFLSDFAVMTSIPIPFLVLYTDRLYTAHLPLYAIYIRGQDTEGGEWGDG